MLLQCSQEHNRPLSDLCWTKTCDNRTRTLSREEIGAANKRQGGNSMTRHFPIAALLLMLFCPAALAQDGVPAAATGTNGPSVAFPPATQPLPSPLLSASGRFSSLNPPNQVVCHNGNVTGRVVSIRLIRVDQFECDD